jgi:putative heme-binding domain-containing protein
MRLSRLMAIVATSVVASVGVMFAAAQGGRGQAPVGRGAAPAPIKNPVEGNADAIRVGGDAYRARCASCHGADAKGAALGSDLTGLWAAGSSDVQIFQSVRRGVPNTLLPHSFGPDNDIWAILAYVRSVNVPTTPSRGNPEAGGAAFVANCSSCHQVNGRGGRVGPDLSRVGASRSRPLLAHKIRHPSAYIMLVYQGGIVIDGYQPVTLVTRDGQRIRGLKKNEDAFSIQIMDPRERIQGYVKSNLREVVNDTTSLMPEFGPDKISDRDLDDLLAYLGTLRATDSGRRVEQ